MMSRSAVAGWLTATFAGLDVVPGRVLCRGAVYLFLDVLQVVAFAQGGDNCHRLIRRQPERRNCP